MNIYVADAVRDVVLVGCLEITGLQNSDHDLGLWNNIDMLCRQYREQYSTPAMAMNELKPARNLYNALGMEPTRHRPSSEALLRRVLKDKPLYTINTIVDTCNYCSLRFLLPIGLYDTSKIKGDVMIRLGAKNEEYQGIRKDMIHVADRLTLGDDGGAFGNPSADSERTSVDLNTRDILLVIFAPSGYSEKKMQQHLDFVAGITRDLHPQNHLLQMKILPD